MSKQDANPPDSKEETKVEDDKSKKNPRGKKLAKAETNADADAEEPKTKKKVKKK